MNYRVVENINVIVDHFIKTYWSCKKASQKDSVTIYAVQSLLPLLIRVLAECITIPAWIGYEYFHNDSGNRPRMVSIYFCNWPRTDVQMHVICWNKTQGYSQADSVALLFVIRLSRPFQTGGNIVLSAKNQRKVSIGLKFRKTSFNLNF